MAQKKAAKDSKKNPKKKPEEKTLSHLQKRFVDEYCRDPSSPARAYERARNATPGTVKRANHIAWRYLHEEAYKHVQLAITKRFQEASKEAKIETQRLLEEDSKIAFADIRQLFSPDDWTQIPPSELPEEIARCVKSVKVRETDSTTYYFYELYDKGKAIERLGKYLGLYVEKREHTGEGGGPIQHKHEHEVIRSALDELEGKDNRHLPDDE